MCWWIMTVAFLWWWMKCQCWINDCFQHCCKWLILLFCILYVLSFCSIAVPITCAKLCNFSKIMSSKVIWKFFEVKLFYSISIWKGVITYWLSTHPTVKLSKTILLYVDALCEIPTCAIVKLFYSKCSILWNSHTKFQHTAW